MKNGIARESVIVKVSIASDGFKRMIEVGGVLNGIEVFGIVIRKNASELITVIALDEDDNICYTLNVMNPLLVEVFEKTIAVDGPPEQ